MYNHFISLLAFVSLLCVVVCEKGLDRWAENRGLGWNEVALKNNKHMRINHEKRKRKGKRENRKYHQDARL